MYSDIWRKSSERIRKYNNFIKSEAELALVQLTREAKLPTIVGLTTMYAFCRTQFVL